MLYCLNSFGHVPWFQCLSGATVSFVSDRRVVKVNYMIKSLSMFYNVGTFNTLFCISDMFFSSQIPLTRCIGDYVNNATLIVFRRSKLVNRKFLLQCFCWFVEDLDAVGMYGRHTLTWNQQLTFFCKWNKHLWVCALTLNQHFKSIFEVAHWREINILSFFKWHQHLWAWALT